MTWFPTASISLFIVFAGAVLRAERLPVYTYTTQHGLASDSVFKVSSDSRGYVWFATRAGISRFDGYRFTNYGTAHGLPPVWIQDILEDRNGRYWVAAGRKGACVWVPAESAPARFKCYALEHNPSVTQLYEDSSGRIWIGTSNGAFITSESSSAPKFSRVSFPPDTEILAMKEDRTQTMWFGTNGHGVFRRSPSGHLEVFAGAARLRTVRALIADRTGRIWAGTEYGLALLRADSRNGESLVEKMYSARRGSPIDVSTVHEGFDGTIWFGTSEALGKLSNSMVTTYTVANGLTQNPISSIDHDLNGNLWIGTRSGGVMKMAYSGLTSFSEADGLATVRIYSLFEDRAGRVCTVAGLMRDLFLGCLEGNRFQTIRPRVPRQINYFGWGHDRIALQDRAGEWWIATGSGLLRYPRRSKVELLARTPPKAVYTETDGLCGNDVFRIFEDSRGDIWVSTINKSGLARWNRQTGSFQRYCDELGHNEGGYRQTPSAFAEDAAGHLWMALYHGGLARHDGHAFRIFSAGQAVPATHIPSMYLDEKGTLWAANFSSGLIEVENPASEPRFKLITASEGLSSNNIQSIVSDGHGQLYIGTDRGLDRLDLRTREVRHYSAEDGLPNTYVELSHRDRSGNFWFASSSGGLARLTARPELPQIQPRVLITRLRISGADHPMPELGASSVPALHLASANNNLEIHFSGMHIPPGSSLRYEYRLEGADENWTASGEPRPVNYASLAPGKYRFVARAANANQILDHASVAFTIEPPLAKRPWFLVLMLLTAGGTAYAAHRYRLGHAVRLERLRMRIAADLHDDIGSSLSQIALLTEVARRNLNGQEQALEPVVRIGQLSSEAAESMSDLVWAINPHRDTLHDLNSRMRRFANDLFEARGVEVVFSSDSISGLNSDMLMPDVRRAIYLIYKEALNNIVKHAACTRVAIQFGVDRGQLVLKVQDNGRGFPDFCKGDGHGFESMRSRAELPGGEFHIAADPGNGTTLTVSIPLRGTLKNSNTSPPEQAGPES